MTGQRAHWGVALVLVMGAAPAVADDAELDAVGTDPSPLDAGAAPEASIAPTYDLDAGTGIESGVLSGIVQVRGTREPLAVALVTTSDQSFETGADGRFAIVLPPGPVKVHVAAAGHFARDFTEVLSTGQRLEVIYRLDRNSAIPYQTTVRDQRARTEVARIALHSEEAHETPGTMGEPLRSVMQLPGVSAVVSGLAYPVVRGTDPAATAYFLDGVRIPQLFHALAGPSVIHPDFIDSVDFYPGLAPARFGRLLGGAIEATTARPSDHVSITGSIDLINASAFAQVPIDATGTSVTVAARASYTPLIGAKIASAIIPHDPGTPPTDVVANFYDYQARIIQKVGAGKLRLLAFGSNDEVGTRPTDVYTPSGIFSATFHRVDLLWQVPLGIGTFEAGATFGRDVTGLTGDQGAQRAFDLNLSRWLGSARLGWNATLAEGLTLRAGIDAEFQSDTTDASGISGSLLRNEASASHTEAQGILAGAFVELRWVAGPLETLAGARLDLYSRFPDVTWVSAEPRLEERLRLNDRICVRAGAGLFHQPPTLALNFPVSDLALLDEGLQYAAHTEVGVDVQLPLGLELGVTGFYDPLFKTMEHSITELLYPSGTTAPRPGTAYGGELFLRRAAAGRFFGWLSATVQRSERLTTVYRFSDNGDVLATLQTNVPSAFDQTLVMHAVLGVRLPFNISAGVSLNFNTGRPEDGEVSTRTQRAVRDPATGELYWTTQDLDRVSRLPPYFRVDARVAKRWDFNDWTLEAYLDVMNASLTQEVLGYSYTAVNGQLQRSPIEIPLVLPMLGVKGKY